MKEGWRWSENVKPIAGTDSCQVLHTDVIPPGHDAWMVDDDPVVSVDVSRVTAERYAREQ